MTRLNQTGSHVIVLAVGLLVIAGLGFTGYRVWHANQPVASTSPVTSQTTAPATIQTKADLTQASKALDSSSSQLNSNLDDSSLNADLSSML